MAVENQDKKYYKINFNKCKVEGYNVFVDYFIYDNLKERQKEKERETYFNLFFERLQEQINTLQNEYYMEFESGKFNTEEEYINSPLYAKELLINELFKIFSSIKYCFYKINGESTDMMDINLSSDILNQCGFKQEWVNDPICYTGGGTVNCGEYNKEIIDYSFYYDKLKLLLNESILYDV